MKTIQKKIMLAAVLAVLMAPLAACNTIEGIGRDAKAAGEAVTGAASKSKGY